ncbi:MAG: SUMF1/EgtB/PvdO family nonheme iron enzyme, partial [Deltaproteobacteria bacterium]|nr:SUMF1/EgtB/PvdO family nonheme iron enzyme [Deltaproteobacteria bacterium]
KKPECAGKDCGDDGCGGTCGKCGTGQTCEAGACKAVVTCTDCSGTVDVPAGTFWMGCNPATGPGCPDPAETPYHEVSLSAYRIDRYEVTNARLVDFLNNAASDVCGGRSRSDCVAVSTSTSPVYYDEPPASGPLSFHVKPGRENDPAQVARWLGAVAFCQFWAKGHVCSEAQWERAARGTDGRSYPWGNGEPGCDLVVVKGEGGFGCPGVAGPMHVGSVPAGQSPCGAMDMAGNAAEWVYDYYDAGYYQSGPKQDPVQSEDVEGAGMGVLRGGSWAGYNLEALWKPFMTFTRAWSKQTNPAGFRCCYEVAP